LLIDTGKPRKTCIEMAKPVSRCLVTVIATTKKLCKSNELENRVVYKLKIMWSLVTTSCGA